MNTKPPPITEADVTRACLAALAVHGIKLDRRNVGGIRRINKDGSSQYIPCGVPGDSDFTGTLPGGKRFDLEIKRPGKKPSKKQLARLRRVNELGGIGLWVDDAGNLARVLPRLLQGWRCEIDEDGYCWVTDE